MQSIKKHISGLDLHMKEVVSGAFISLLLRVSGAVVQFGFSVLVARWFGAKGFGVYALALSIVLIASAFGRWGLDQAALKHISVYKDKNEGEGIKATFNKAALLISGISILVSIFLFLLAIYLLLLPTPIIHIFMAFLSVSCSPICIPPSSVRTCVFANLHLFLSLSVCVGV